MSRGRLLPAAAVAAFICVPGRTHGQASEASIFLGELRISIVGDIKTIRLEAVGDVWGSKYELPPYPLTHEFDLYQETRRDWAFQHVDDSRPQESYKIGYGRYKITIVEDGKSIDVDYRDCNYTDPQYYDPPAADVTVTYDPTTRTFTLDPPSGNVWDLSFFPEARKTGCFLKVQIDGPTSLPPGQNGTFTAETHGVWPISTYQWFKRHEFERPIELPSGWFAIGDNSPTVETGGPQDFSVKVRVTDTHGDWREAYHYVSVGSRRVAESSFEAVAKGLSLTPSTFQLYPAFPNPFNPETRIRYDLAAGGRVTLAVYTLPGKRIRTLVTAEQGPGSYGVLWDGKGGGGREVSLGVYLVRLSVRADEGSKASLMATRRVMRIR